MKNIVLAMIAATAFTAVSQADFIGSLDGSSTSSTFETASTADPLYGWESITAQSGVVAPIRAFVNGADVGGMIHGNTATWTFSAQYDTAVPVAANTTYTLETTVGNWGSTGGTTHYRIAIGHLDGSDVWTELATKDFDFSAPGEIDVARNNALTTDLVFTTGASVASEDVAVRIEYRGRTDTSNWAGFDTVTLDAIPEPATLGLVGLFGGGIFFIRRKLAM